MESQGCGWDTDTDCVATMIGSDQGKARGKGQHLDASGRTDVLRARTFAQMQAITAIRSESCKEKAAVSKAAKISDYIVVGKLRVSNYMMRDSLTCLIRPPATDDASTRRRSGK